jgi:hypothetical protein
MMYEYLQNKPPTQHSNQKMKKKTQEKHKQEIKRNIKYTINTDNAIQKLNSAARFQCRLATPEFVDSWSTPQTGWYDDRRANEHDAPTVTGRFPKNFGCTYPVLFNYHM